MTEFDQSQLQVLGLDPVRHARVLGAPGTGKTLTLVEAYAAFSSQPGWQDGDVLIISPTRLAASRLRRQVERRLQRAVAGTPVRTMTSLAFSVMQRHAALSAEIPPRLLTGTAQDEAATEVVERLLAGEVSLQNELPFLPEVLRSEAFRGELRELGRVLDDFHLRPNELAAKLMSLAGANSFEAGELPDTEMTEHWIAALELLERVSHQLRLTRPAELSASAMMWAAGELLQRDTTIGVPKLVLIDDAGELGEGQLSLLAALASRSCAIWAFGDPDTSTSAFQGERAPVMAGLHEQLRRRGWEQLATTAPEQVVVLSGVHRHDEELRSFVSALTERIGAAGAGQQRTAKAITHETGALSTADSRIEFATAVSAPEQLGAVAHRLRARHLGISTKQPLAWGDMAVLCRTRGDAVRVAKLLAAERVPTSVAAGGIVLRDHLLVRELIRLLQHSMGISLLSERELPELLGGVIGGLDPIAIRRLRSAVRLQELQTAQSEGREPASVDLVLFEAFELAGEVPLIDMAPARSLRNLGRLVRAARLEHAAGATPREVLWSLWSGSGLPPKLQAQALEGRGTKADEAHRTLDAVTGLFFALQRHEEQDSEQSIESLLNELLRGAVPEDSLAQRSERDVVTVGTPQSVIGREFELVCVLGLQDGTWPNLRARGSLLGVAALERWLRGMSAVSPSRRDTLHDELRLFTQAASRARRELLVVAVSNESEQPSTFFSLGRDYQVESTLPSSRLTLRGLVAQMRRRVVRDPADLEAVRSLALLAQEGVAGAHPDDWYGVRPPSSVQPLADIEHDPEARVYVSPSQVERAERCPLDWVISRLGGGASDYRANLGTLFHHALEHLKAPTTAEQVLEQVQQGWGNLRFEAEWQEQRARTESAAMAQAIADYLNRFERSQQRLLATESAFEVALQFARLRGVADRLEAVQLPDGSVEITVVDLKTGRRRPTAKELAQHAQLQAYQLGVLQEAFVDGEGDPIAGRAAGAKLVYIHPESLTKTQQGRGETYTEISQHELDDQSREIFEERVIEIARVMAGAEFVAQVEHHCENPNVPGKSCALHVIPAVSHQ